MRVGPQHPRSTAFLLSQVGAHGASLFAKRLAALGLAPAHAGTLRIIRSSSGISQQALSTTLGLPASRLVALLDELEERGLVERRGSPEDRRVHALHLTRKGEEALEAIGVISREHDDALCSPLSAEERRTLAALLHRIAEQQGLTPGVHPGFSRVGRSSKDGAADEPRRSRKRRRR